MVSLLNFLFPDAEGALEVIKSTVFVCLNYLFVKKNFLQKKRIRHILIRSNFNRIVPFHWTACGRYANSNKNVVKVTIHVNGGIER